MTKSYHINELAISLTVIATVKSLNCFIIFGVQVEVFLFFHQVPQVETESGAEGEEDIGDSQEPLWTTP